MKIILFASLIAVASLSFGQGRVDGFLKGSGNLDIAIGASYEAAPKYYAGTNLIESGLGRDVFSTSAFIAYGITNGLDVNVSVPYVNVNGSVGGLQDPSVFLKYRLISFGGVKMNRCVELKGQKSNSDFKLDVILAGGFSSNITDYQTGGLNALGQQAKVIDIRPVVQIYLPKSMFLTIQGGYNYKFDPVPNAAVFAVKLGIAKANWYADFWYDSQYANGGFDYLGTPAPPSFRELGVSFQKIGGTFYKPINGKLGTFAGLSYVLSGRNMSKGFGGNIGIVYKPNLKK
ncbi:MAG: hypothetical protein AB8B72_14150 [Crocinitomicaceae bacterium]